MKSALLTLFVALFANVASASTVTVGNDLIDRPSRDGWGNFNMIYTDLVLSTGRLTEWSAYGARSGLASLLVVSNAPGNGFNVEGVFDMSLVAGQVTTSAIDFEVQSGWMLGLYQGAGRVDFTYSSGPTNIRFSNNNSGQAVAGTFLATPNGRNNQVRTYSFAAQLAAVPIPATLPLIGGALMAAGLIARNRRRLADI